MNERKRVSHSPSLAAMQQQMHLDSTMLLDDPKPNNNDNVVESSTSLPNLRTPSIVASLKARNAAKRNDTNNTKTPTTVKRRRTKKMSRTEHVKQTKDFLDVKRPSSVLAETNLRALFTNASFQRLKPSSQKALINLLPSVDRPKVDPNSITESVRLNASSLNNEFFNRACIEWRERLAYGEFTNENQTKLKAEAEKEKCKIDPWKQKNFEYIWGEKIQSLAPSNSDSGKKFKINETLLPLLQKSASEMKDIDSQQENLENSKKYKESRCKVEIKTPPRRIRTGVITRSSSSFMKMETVDSPDKDDKKPPDMTDSTEFEYYSEKAMETFDEELDKVDIKTELEKSNVLNSEEKSCVEFENENEIEVESELEAESEPEQELDNEIQQDSESTPSTEYRKIFISNSEMQTTSLDNIPRDEMVPSPILEGMQMNEEDNDEIVLETTPSDYSTNYEIANQCSRENNFENGRTDDDDEEEEDEEEEDEDMQPLNLQVIRDGLSYDEHVEKVQTVESVHNDSSEMELSGNDVEFSKMCNSMESHPLRLNERNVPDESDHIHEEQDDEELLENETQESPIDRCCSETDDSSKIYNDTMLNEHDYLKNDILIDSDDNQLSPSDQAIEAKETLNHIKNNFDNFLQSNQTHSSKSDYYSGDDVNTVASSSDTGVILDEPIVDYSDVILFSKYNSDSMATVSTVTTTANQIPVKHKTNIIMDDLYNSNEIIVSRKSVENMEYSPPQQMSNDILDSSVVSQHVQRINCNIVNSENIMLSPYGNASRSTTTQQQQQHVANANNQSKTKVRTPDPEQSPIMMESNDCSGLICNTQSSNELINTGMQRLSYNSVIVQDDQDQYTNCNDGYILEDSNEDNLYCHDKIVNVGNKVKLVIPYNLSNEKYIFEEVRIHKPHQTTTTTINNVIRNNGVNVTSVASGSSTSSTSSNEQFIPNQIFVTPSNFTTYSLKMQPKLEASTSGATVVARQPEKLFKQETNNNQNSTKPQIIYELSTEPKVSYEHSPVYSNDVYNAVVKNSDIYSDKKTIIHTTNKKDGFIRSNNLMLGTKVALQANNNTIILAPIQTQSATQQQGQLTHTVTGTPKNVVIRQSPMIANTQQVQFVQQPFMKKNTVIINPHQITTHTNKVIVPQQHSPSQQQIQPKFSTVIRAPSTTTQVQQTAITQQAIQPIQPAKAVQKPIQKQKVIMSTSSLQQYRHFNQQRVPSQTTTSSTLTTQKIAMKTINHVVSHQPRKQLHPQHIIQPQQIQQIIQSQPQIIQSPQVLQTQQVLHMQPIQTQVLQPAQQVLQQKPATILHQQPHTTITTQHHAIQQHHHQQQQQQQQQQHSHAIQQAIQQHQHTIQQQQQQITIQHQQQQQQQVTIQHQQQVTIQHQQQQQQQQITIQQQQQQQQITIQQQHQPPQQQQQITIQQQQPQITIQHQQQQQQITIQQQQQQQITMQQQQQQQPVIQQSQSQQPQQQQQSQQSVIQHQIPILSHAQPTQLRNTNQQIVDEKPTSATQIPVILTTTSTSLTTVPTTSNNIQNMNAQNMLKRPKLESSNKGRGSRINSSKPPPGTVNLERSYQICQAVIQNSPNRHQLNCQLKPPSSLLTPQNIVGGKYVYIAKSNK